VNYRYYGCQNWQFHWYRAQKERPPAALAGSAYAFYVRYTREELGLSSADKFPRVECPQCGKDMGGPLNTRYYWRIEADLEALNGLHGEEGIHDCERFAVRTHGGDGVQEHHHHRDPGRIYLITEARTIDVTARFRATC
jgi:hypothetical protein